MRREGGRSSAASAWVWLDGRLTAAEREGVSLRVAPALEAAGLVETMRLIGGRVPLLDLHLERLRQGCRRIGLARPRAVERAIDALARRCGLAEGVARLTVGEGLELLTLGPLPPGLDRERDEGIRLAALSVSWRPVTLKHTSRAAALGAERRAGGEVVRLGPAGRLMETTRSNLFVVTPEGIATAPASTVLPGVARRCVLEAARELGIPITRRAPRLGEHRAWREVFVTNAVRGVRPVTELAGHALAKPAREGVLRALQAALDRRMGIAR